LLVGGDVDPGGLLTSAFLLFGEVNRDPVVGVAISGCSRLRGQSRRAATRLTSAAYRVRRAQIQPEQQAKDGRERPVHLAGVAQMVADQVATDGLQDLPGDTSDQQQPTDLPGPEQGRYLPGMFQISAIACWVIWVRPRAPHAKATNPISRPIPLPRSPWMLSCTWSPMMGSSATAEPQQALLEAGVMAKQESGGGDGKPGPTPDTATAEPPTSG